jgi:REP element-mobilizing transposase RayT
MGQTNDICPLGFVTKHRHPVFTDAHLSRLVNSLKGVSSRPLPQELPELARHYRRATRLWSGCYIAGSVGAAPLNLLRASIEQQRRPHDHNPPPT